MDGIKMGNTINNSILHKGICDENFRKARVLSIERIDKTIRRSGSNEIQNTVYDLEIEDDHSYIANGIVVHNCHHTPADQTYKALMKSDAYYKLGLSATPKREDGNELKMFAAIGGLVSVTSVKELIKNGTLAKPTIQFINAPTAFEGRTYAESYKNQITLNDPRNRLIAQKAYELQSKGMTVLITVNQIKHGKTLEQMIKGSKFVHGKTKKEERHKAMEEFENGTLQIMISTLLNEGSNIPTLNALIMAGGGKSESAQIQKVGRALRTTDDKKTAIIIDVLDGGKWLRDHSQGRIKVYEEVFG